MTHAPGPWHAGGFSSIVGVPIMAQPDPTKNTFNVCGVAAPISREENMANARLIAKAPDMARLIADIEESLTADDSYSLLRNACRKLLREVGA